MRRSDWEDRCRRHPEHRLSKGVCPSCLRDRLAHLSATSSATTTMTRASNDSASTSPYSSHGSPPLHHAAFSADASSVHVAGGSGGSFVNVSAFSQPLMPTASKKPAAGRKDDEAAARGKEGAEAKKKKKSSSSSKKKIGRFLSRLVGTEKRRRTGDGELFHSSTMKEKTSTTKWVFF
uniref:Uncharacterized protein n=1 Tax=Avena sativa TaxID=4498 RepID=A0ACD5XM08_AVESA